MGWQEYGEVRRRKAVVLDANGNGSVDFDVIHGNERWVITDVISNTDQAQTTTPYPTVTIYLGGIQQGVSEGASWTGNQDIFRGRLVMAVCDTLTVSYSGGVVGSKATCVIEGTRELAS